MADGKRSPLAPDVPTLAELGFKDAEVGAWQGFMGPKGLPPAIIKVWEEAAQKILADPDYKKSYGAGNLIPNYLGHDQYGAFVERFAADTGNFFRSTGVIR